ncbi:MAG: hypothetical protein WAX69_07665 [Victivallales bacterium]
MFARQSGAEISIALFAGLMLGLGGLAELGFAAPTENHVLRSTPAPGPVDLAQDLGKWDRSRLRIHERRACS